ncbi:epoxide hydrolase N-terminal domain-containing protein [Heyndrickxia oleronia]|uniref:epoxide hydrolase N-terminal domain-containing protein n=1 Tax=Heyndrickxia oleronia TaxID=38875 RepID=UPI0024313CF9|nr:epoxide hydrolase N-terminal domain-containing protein [Heyndrickxia oleronia]
MAGYWRSKYDWRKNEKSLNIFPQLTTTIDALELMIAFASLIVAVIMVTQKK